VVFVGKGKEAYTVHKDLLSLHSSWFEDYFQSDAFDEENKVFLPQISNSYFADFICWLYSRESQTDPAIEDHNLTKSLRCGAILGAPAYSNIIMDKLIRYVSSTDPATYNNLWFMKNFENSEEGSPLRLFISHLIAHYNPFSQYPEDSEDYKFWRKMLKKYHQLAFEVSIAAGKKWNGNSPCHIQHRATYMEEPYDLSKRWEEQILRRRTKTDIELAASANCGRSKVELYHLNKDKDVVMDTPVVLE
jgi:hypothetical protein